MCSKVFYVLRGVHLMVPISIKPLCLFSCFSAIALIISKRDLQNDSSLPTLVSLWRQEEKEKEPRKRKFSIGDGPDLLMQPLWHVMPVWLGLSRHECPCSGHR